MLRDVDASPLEVESAVRGRCANMLCAAALLLGMCGSAALAADSRKPQPTASEPRIHFAIVCASKSCPPLQSEAYRAADLDRQLDDAARSFIRNEANNRFDAARRTLHLSSIFKWFREDFEKAAGSLPEFVARYADETTAAAIRAGGVKIDFLDYDWSLNGR